MLTPELKILKEYLEGHKKNINREKLLKELNELDEGNLEIFHESLSMSTGSCPACGRKL